MATFENSSEKIKIYPCPKNFRLLSYQEVQDRIKSFDINKICNIWVFDSLNERGKNLSTEFSLEEIIEILNGGYAEDIAFVERIK